MSARYGLMLQCGLALDQIGGDGRLRLSNGKWVRVTDGSWTVLRASKGQTYDTAEEAQKVADRLNG